MSLLGICQWLEHSALGMGIRDSDWIFYFSESLHVFGIILMVSTVAMVDLRLLGIGILRRQPVSQVAGQFLPWNLDRLRDPVHDRRAAADLGSGDEVVCEPVILDQDGVDRCRRDQHDRVSLHCVPPRG
jgi:hypothetical protein